MTFLPRTGLSGTDESLQGILSVLIALPLSLAGTMFIFYLTNFG